jgi:RHS repeat-associated protein
MLQSGWQMGGSHPIDSLNYTYYTNSNKLKNVIDGRNDPLTTMGDFRTSALSPYNTGKTNTAVDYVYDPNGNMTRDLNKDIGSQTTDGIIYNHLNLPWQVKVRSATGTKGTITYIYDAAGTKLKKTTLDSAGGIKTVTTYIGAFQYQGRQAISGSTPADTLQFFGQEEGRVRVATDTTGGQSRTSFKYDYFLKDHLGNTRMVLTDEQQMDLYPAATMEVGDSATENLYYSKLDSVRTGIPVGYPTDTTTNPNNYVAQLNGSGVKIGPGITLKVMAGDQFSIRASSWYKLNGTSPGAPVNPLPDLLGALISGVGGLPGGHPTPAVLQANSTSLSSNVTEFLQDTGSAIIQTQPHAFINWVLFDNQFNYVAASSGFDQVGGDQELKKHVLTNLPVTTSGYLYIYASNETPNINVFFDNLQVTHTRGPLLEEEHYYPFGLTMAGISDKALKQDYSENKYKFVGQLYDDDLGWDTYQFKFRNHDPQIGRFLQIDPLASKYPYNTTFAYAENRPINGIDLEGKEWLQAIFGDATNSKMAFGVAVANTYVTATDAMQASTRLANGTSAKSSIPGDGPIQRFEASANNLNDKAVAAGPAIQALDATATFASLIPITEAGLPAATLNPTTGFSTAAFDAETNIAEKFSLAPSPTRSISPNVEKTLNMLDNIKSGGGTVKLNPLSSNQELNLTIRDNSSKINLRIETHDLPLDLGGQGKGSPVRHMNVDLTPGQKALPNSGHVIL